MRIIIYTLPKVKQREMTERLMKGFLANGDYVSIYPAAQAFHSSTDRYELRDADLAVMIGGQSFSIYGQCRSRVPTLFVDKAYVGRRDYYRLVLNGYLPYYLDELAPNYDRMELCQIPFKPRVAYGKFIIYAGSSNAYCQHHGLGGALEYDRRVCAQIVRQLQALTVADIPKTIMYRMKASLVPRDHLKQYSMPDTLPPGVQYCPPDVKLTTLLPDAHCVVTFGSNAAIEAIANGVPAVVLSSAGINPAWSIAEHNDVLNPYWAPDDRRRSLLGRLAQVQFSAHDIESGLAWAIVRPWLGRGR
jgi:hypothetical protein